MPAGWCRSAICTNASAWADPRQHLALATKCTSSALGVAHVDASRLAAAPDATVPEAPVGTIIERARTMASHQPGYHLFATLPVSALAIAPTCDASAGTPRRGLHRRRLAGWQHQPAAGRAVPRVGGLFPQPLCARPAASLAAARLARSGAPLPWLRRLTQPVAACLSLRRLRRDRLDPAGDGRALARAALCGRRIAGRQRAAQMARTHRRARRRSIVARAAAVSAPMDLSTAGPPARTRIESRLHLALPALAQAQESRQAGTLPWLVRRPRGRARSQLCTSSTTS